MTIPEKELLLTELARQLLADYQELQRTQAWTKRQLKHTEAFLDDARDDARRVEDNLKEKEREHRKLTEICSLAIEQGEALGQLVDDMLDGTGLKDRHLTVLKRLKEKVEEMSIPF